MTVGWLIDLFESLHGDDVGQKLIENWTRERETLRLIVSWERCAKGHQTLTRTIPCEDLCDELKSNNKPRQVWSVSFCSDGNWLPNFSQDLKFMTLGRRRNERSSCCFVCYNTHELKAPRNKAQANFLRVRMNVNVWPDPRIRSPFWSFLCAVPGRSSSEAFKHSKGTEKLFKSPPPPPKLAANKTDRTLGKSSHHVPIFKSVSPFVFGMCWRNSLSCLFLYRPRVYKLMSSVAPSSIRLV